MSGSLLAAGSAMLVSSRGGQKANASSKIVAAERACRFVHFTDTHVGGGPTMPFCATDHGYPKALAHVHAMDDPPEFILHTGDIITDAFWASRAETVQQWTIYNRIMREHCAIPVRYTLGNHDVNFGWDWGDANTPFPGKVLALEQVGLSSPYYSFDHGGWHFVVLDNTQRGGYNGFTHHLDEAQYIWLEQDLTRTPVTTPILIASHAPILTVTCFFCPSNKQHADGLVIPNDWVHTDVEKLHKLLRRHRNVRLCLSGHFHTVDHVQYLGVHHICGGAVCADYWRRPPTFAPEHEAGYGVVDLFKDGSFEYRYVDYGLVGYQDDPKRARYPDTPFMAAPRPWRASTSK